MPCDIHLLPHTGIQSLTPYVPGKSVETLRKEQGISDIIKLASNENQLGCSPHVLQALSSLTPSEITTYPIYTNHPLHKKLAQTLQVDADWVVLGNGTDSLCPLLLTCFALHSGKQVLTHQYAFSMYEIQSKTLGIPVCITPVLPNFQVDIDAIIAASCNNTALIFIANPNNPTGLLIPSAEIKRLLQHIPEDTLLILDEAYYEYVDDENKLDSIALLNQYPNLVITRTFSKIYGLAGLRLGYAIANPAITTILHRVQLPFSVNKAALEAANVALDDKAFFKKTIENNVNGLRQMKQGLASLNLSYLPTAGNFITIDFKRESLPIYQGLLRHGIIVRPLHPYGLDHYLRVTIGTPQQNSRFLTALEGIIT